MRRNSRYLLHSPSVVAAVRSLFAVGCLGHNVGSWRRSLVGGRRSVDSKVSLRLVDVQIWLGSSCLGLALRRPQIDLWSLPHLLDLRSVVMSLGGLGPRLASREANLRALVGKLRFELRDVGSSELVGECWAIDTELTAS